MKNTEKPKGYTVRNIQTGDRVYLIKDGTRAWIKNPETLETLGFKFGDEKTIKYADFLKFKEAQSLDLDTPENRVPPSVPEVVEIENEDGTKTKGIASKPILGYRTTATPYDEI